MRNLVKLQWGAKSNLGVYVGLVSAWTNKDDEKKQKKSYIIWNWAPQLLILDHPKTCFVLKKSRNAENSHLKSRFGEIELGSIGTFVSYRFPPLNIILFEHY
jgi:hypothetical protein